MAIMTKLKFWWAVKYSNRFCHIFWILIQNSIKFFERLEGKFWDKWWGSGRKIKNQREDKAYVVGGRRLQACHFACKAWKEQSQKDNITVLIRFTFFSCKFSDPQFLNLNETFNSLSNYYGNIAEVWLVSILQYFFVPNVNGTFYC